MSQRVPVQPKVRTKASKWPFIIIGIVLLLGLIIAVVAVVSGSNNNESSSGNTSGRTFGETNTGSTDQQTDIDVNYCVTCPDNEVRTNVAVINRVYTEGHNDIQTITKTSTGYNLRVVRTNADGTETVMEFDAPEIDGSPFSTTATIISTTTDTLGHLLIEVSDIVGGQSETYIVPLVQ